MCVCEKVKCQYFTQMEIKEEKRKRLKSDRWVVMMTPVIVQNETFFFLLFCNSSPFSCSSPQLGPVVMVQVCCSIASYYFFFFTYYSEANSIFLLHSFISLYGVTIDIRYFNLLFSLHIDKRVGKRKEEWEYNKTCMCGRILSSRW